MESDMKWSLTDELWSGCRTMPRVAVGSNATKCQGSHHGFTTLT